MSTESKKNGGSVLDPLLESASDEVLRLAAGTIFGQLLNPHSPITQQIAQMEHPSGPERRLGNLYELLSAMGGFKHGRVTPEMQTLTQLSTEAGTPVFADHTPQDYGVHPGFLAELLRMHTAGGDTDALMNRYLRAGEGTVANPGRYAPRESLTRSFGAQTKVNLPGLEADFRMRTTGQGAPTRLLPEDVTNLYKLHQGITAVNAQMDRDISNAVEAVRADQASKLREAHGMIARIQTMVPGLIQSFKETLGVRDVKTLVTDQRDDSRASTRTRPDGETLTSSRSSRHHETQEISEQAPARPGGVQLPSFEFQAKSFVPQVSAAGFGMRNGEVADVTIHKGTDFIEVTATGEDVYVAAQYSEVHSETTIRFDGGFIRVER